MEEGGPVKLQEEVDSIGKKVIELDKDIEKYDSKEWATTSQCTTKHFKEQKEELLTQQRALQSKLDDNVPLLRSIVGDQTRLINTHQQRMAKLNEGLEAAKKRQEDGQRIKTERLQEQTDKHLQEMARLEEHAENSKRTIERDISKLKEQLEEEEKEYKQRRTEVGTELAKQAGPGLTEAFATFAMGPVEASETAAGKDTIAQVLMKKQKQLGVGEQLQESQIQNVAATMADLFQELKNDMMKQIMKDMMKQQEAEKEEEVEAAESEKDKDEQWKQQGRRRTSRSPDAMVDDSTERTNAVKRAGEDLGAEEAEQN